MANKVGQNIRILLALLEKHGELSGAQMCQIDSTLDREQLGKYCSRAVGLGLATVKRGNRSRSNPDVFKAVPGWLEMADQRKTTRLAPSKPKPTAPVLTTSAWSEISNIFQPGAQHG